jgi:hypothetical protein
MAIAAATNIINFFDGRLDSSLVVNQDEIQVRTGAAMGA